jgi:hypothetical protein
MFHTALMSSSARRPLNVATGIVMAGALILTGSGQAFAATATSSQTVTGSSPAGVLSVTAPGTLALPSLVGGASTAATNLGSVSWTDTLGTATASSVTMAATDLYNAATVGGYIPFSHFTITVDQAPNANALNNGPNAIAGAASQTLTGADTTPGTTYSDAITLATASTTSSGTWTQSLNKITVGVPANTIPATLFTATIQYTITG